MNIEVGLISKVLHDGDYTVIADNQITLKYLSGRNKKALKFIQDHMMKYGKVPSVQVFEKKLPNYKLEVEESLEEGLQYYCDEVRKKYKHNTIVDVTEEITEHIDKLETDEAYELIKKLVLIVENEIILSDRQEVNKNTKTRLEDYHERAKAGGMTGIPSGIDRIDYVLKGYNAEELIALIGFTGTGKTWFELIQAVYMAKQGYRVLLFTTEMSSKMMIRRIDAIWCKLNYTRFRDGRLTRDELKKYEKYLNTIEGDTDSNIIVEQATGGISQVGAKIDQHNPDIVFVDGAYLLEDEEKGEDDWKALVRIFRGLKRLARSKKVPVYASTQSNEQKASLGAISFAKHIRADCDVIMALEQDDEMKEDKEMGVKFLKIREGEIPGRVLMQWDFNEMQYGTIYIEGDNGNRSNKDMKNEDEEEQDDNSTDVMSGVQILQE